MSGGSWDYFYHQLDDVADRLASSDSPERRAFGSHLKKCACAMKAIEWVDSCDCVPPHDTNAIRDAIGEGLNGHIIAEAQTMAVETLEVVKESLLKIKALQPVNPTPEN